MAVPVALAVFAALEACLAPFGLYRSDPLLAVEVSGHVSRLAYESLLGSVAYAVAVAMVETALSRMRLREGKRADTLRASGHFALAAAVTAYAYFTLLRYEQFKQHPELAVPYVGACVCLAALAWALGSPWAERRMRLRGAAAIASVVGFGALHVLNHRLLPGAYFTMHLSILQLSIPVLFLGVAYGLKAVPRRPLWGVGLAALLVVTVLPIASSLTWSSSRSTAIEYTLIGQSQVVLHPFSAASEKSDSRTLFDPDGVDRFLRTSALPVLPETFDLADYNIVLVSSEAVRFDRTSLANPGHKTTPNLATLVRDGAFWFSHAHSPSSATLASNASLMSMTYPHATYLQTWAKSWCGQLLDKEKTVAELLRKADYGTFRITHDFHQGFTYNLLGLGQGFQTQEFFPEESKEEGLTLDKRIAERAAAVIREHRDRRFFAWVYFAAPHEPYYARYDDWPSETTEQRYLQELRYMDEAVGMVLDALRRDGLYDKTIVVFLADHGEELGEHGGSGHQTLYAECTNVPLVVRVPGVSGRRIDAPTSTLYTFPWLLLHGRGALRTAAERRMTHELGPMMKATRGAVITELIGHDKMSTGLLTADHKVIYNFIADAMRVHDLRTDPSEQNDMLGDRAALAPARAIVDAYRETREALNRYSIDTKRKPSKKKARRRTATVALQK